METFHLIFLLVKMNGRTSQIHKSLLLHSHKHTHTHTLYIFTLLMSPTVQSRWITFLSKTSYKKATEVLHKLHKSKIVQKQANLENSFS